MRPAEIEGEGKRDSDGGSEHEETRESVRERARGGELEEVRAR